MKKQLTQLYSVFVLIGGVVIFCGFSLFKENFVEKLKVADCSELAKPVEITKCAESRLKPYVNAE